MKHQPALQSIFRSALVLVAFFLGSTGLHAQSVTSGGWSKKNYSASGKWEIVKGSAGHRLKLTGFKTRKGPDLKLFLHPLPGKSITGSNATTGAILIAPLKSPSGDQTYSIPASVDPGRYKTLLLLCEKFKKPWAVGAL